MNNEMQKVVGVAFIEDGKLLIVQSQRSKTTNSWTFVGGEVEKGETVMQAAVREVKEEIHNGFTITEKDLVPLLCFKEHAASDPTLMIEMTIFLCNKKIAVALIPNDEILSYHWFEIGETAYNISSAIRDHFIPYAVVEGLLY